MCRSAANSEGSVRTHDHVARAIDDRVPLPDGFRRLEDSEAPLLRGLFPAAVDMALADQAANAVIRVWREDPSHWDASILTFGAEVSTFRRPGPLLNKCFDADSELVSGEVIMRDDGFIDYICFAKEVDVTDLSEDETEWNDVIQNTATPLRAGPPAAIAEIRLEGPFEAEDPIHGESVLGPQAWALRKSVSSAWAHTAVGLASFP